jgi:hypothetical protein
MGAGQSYAARRSKLGSNPCIFSFHALKPAARHVLKGLVAPVDELFQQQAGERDRTKREALLQKVHQLSIDRVMYAPVFDLHALMGVGPRIAKHTITDVWMSPFPSYEDIELKQ